MLLALLLRVVFRSLDVLLLATRARPLLGPYLLLLRLPAPRADFRQALLAQRHALQTAELTWGESFLSSSRRLLRAYGCGPQSTLVDLGAGHGAVLLAARSLGAAARGVEIDDVHAAAAGILATAGAELAIGDARCADVRDATHVWLTWTCMRSDTRAAIAEHLAQRLPTGAVVFSTTWSLRAVGTAFEELARRRLPFSWGVADVIVSRKR